MVDYTDCVLKKTNKQGKVTCWGLRETLCMSGIKCPFYASESEYERDKSTGFIKKKGVKKNEKIYI